jgi:hypothetical protein
LSRKIDKEQPREEPVDNKRGIFRHFLRNLKISTLLAPIGSSLAEQPVKAELVSYRQKIGVGRHDSVLSTEIMPET